MNHHADLKTFDGLDNRKEIMILLQKLGSDEKRANFIRSLLPHSLKDGLAKLPVTVSGACDPVAAYFMMVGMCNELGVSINMAARKLEAIVSKGG